MKTDMPYIHLFKTPGGFYIYDVNKNTIIHADKDTYELLRNHPVLEEACMENEEIKLLIERGYLSGERVDEIVHPVNELLAFYLENKVNSIILQVTQQCNLRCEYCVYSGSYNNRIHANKRMTKETAFKAIDFLFAHSRDSKRINIGFYGGEPLLEFDLIRECIEYAEKKSEGKALTFNLTSNGTLLSDEVVAFFEKHSVSVLISLDGPKEMHDRHRKQAGSGCGSFDIIMENLARLKKSHSQYADKIRFSVVLDPQSDFSCVNEFFTTYDAVKDAGTSTSVISSKYSKNQIKVNEDFVVKRNYEIFKVLLHKLGRLDRKYVSSLMLEEYVHLRKLHDNSLIPSKSIGAKGHHGGPCVPGITRLFVNVNGDFYPCERVSEASEVMRIGRYVKSIEIKEKPDAIVIGIPGGVMPFNNRFTNGFGMVAFEISQAVVPDAAVFSILYEDYEKENLESIFTLVKHRLGFEIDSFNLSNTKFDWEASKQDDEISYITVDLQFLHSAKTKLGAIHLPVYSILDTDDALEMTRSIIGKLEEYAEVQSV